MLEPEINEMRLAQPLMITRSTNKKYKWSLITDDNNIIHRMCLVRGGGGGYKCT